MNKKEKLKEELLVVNVLILTFRIVRFTVFFVGYGWLCWLIIMSSGPILTTLNLVLFLLFIFAMMFFFKILHYARKDYTRITKELRKI